MRITTATAFMSLALAACSQAPADPRGVDRGEVLLQVVATGRADARPDQARFTAGVQTEAATAAAASGGNADVMNRVAAALDRLGVKPDDIQTRQITLARIEYGPARGRFQAPESPLLADAGQQAGHLRSALAAGQRHPQRVE